MNKPDRMEFSGLLLGFRFTSIRSS